MKQKVQALMKRMTIAKMLWGLVLVGILVIVGLAATSLLSNSRLVRSQTRLTEIVMPMERASQNLREAVTAFVGRKYLITEARTLAALDELAEATAYEAAFNRNIDILKELNRKMAALPSVQGIGSLQGAGEAAEADSEGGLLESLQRHLTLAVRKSTDIYQAARTRLRLKSAIKEKAKMMDELGGRLHQNAERFADQIARAIRERLTPAGQGGGPADRTVEFYLADLAETQKTGVDLRLNIAFLTNYGHKVLLLSDEERIAAIRSEKIEPTAGNVRRGLAQLKLRVAESEELSGLLEEIGTAFESLRSLLLDAETGIVHLHLRWLAEEAAIADRNAALNNTTDGLMAGLDDLQTISDRVRNRAESEARRVQDVWKIILLVSIIAIAAMALMGRRIHRRIMGPINRTVEFAEAISEGDLTAEIEKTHEDEVGLLIAKLSEMAHNLNALIGQVQRSGIQVTSSATELSATSKQQEAVMRTQMESTNNVVQSVAEISNISEELVETMKRVAAMSEQTADYANSGQDNLSQMEEAMHHMESASKSISGKLEAINEKAANITSVVTTITKVADQTNLLSLNAAIEAEKAGEYGRGFTVVAREIRRLADQTAVATLDIDQMVQEMQSAVSAGVMEMDAFIAEVQRSAENVGQISTQLTRIIEQVKSLTPSFEGVNESMQFQSENAQQINTAMVNLSEEMQQTVESLQESFMAIEQLNDAARGLQDEVSRFKVA
jgi:methyl-accepting chemotaxis protein